MSYSRTFYRAQAHPSVYEDPDKNRAENLAKAAWYLYQAGMDAEAQRLTGIIAEISQDVKPGKTGAKKLGRVTYHPSGLIEVSDSYIEVPAPKFDVDIASSRKDVRKSYLDLCRAELSWFASRQLAAKLDNLETPRVDANGKPARRLKQVQGLCKDFDPKMPREMAEVLYRKLDKLLANNPTSTETTSENFNILYDRGLERYVYYLHYLTNAQIDMLLSRIDIENGKVNERGLAQDLRQISRDMPRVTWHGISDDHPCRGDTTALNKAVLDAVPEVMGHDDNGYPLKIDGMDYEWRRNHTKMIHNAVYAARDTANLMLANIALMHADNSIKDILAKAGMMDPELKILPDLHKKAARVAFMASVPKDVPDEAAIRALDVFMGFMKDLD